MVEKLICKPGVAFDAYGYPNTSAVPAHARELLQEEVVKSEPFSDSSQEARAKAVNYLSRMEGQLCKVNHQSPCHGVFRDFSDRMRKEKGTTLQGKFLELCERLLWLSNFLEEFDFKNDLTSYAAQAVTILQQLEKVIQQMESGGCDSGFKKQAQQRLKALEKSLAEPILNYFANDDVYGEVEKNGVHLIDRTQEDDSSFDSWNTIRLEECKKKYPTAYKDLAPFADLAHALKVRFTIRLIETSSGPSGE